MKLCSPSIESLSAALRVHSGAFADCKRLAYSYLSPKNYIVFNLCGSGNTNLSCKQAIFTNLCVMSEICTRL